MIKRIKIEGYKSIRSLDLTLQPLSVIFGPNAAGKSNFLDCLQLLSRLATSRTLKEAFDAPYRGKPLESFSMDATGVEGLREKTHANFSIEVDIELSDTTISGVEREIAELRGKSESGRNPSQVSGKTPSFVHHRFLRYRIEVSITPKSGFLQVSDEYLAALDKDGSLKKKPSPFLERKNEKIYLRMEGQAHPIYFDRFLDHSIASRPHYGPHYPHLAALKYELSRWLFYYFEPREKMRAATPLRETRQIGPMGEDLASFLHTLKSSEARQFEGLQKALRILIPSIEGVEVEVNPFGEVELFILEEGHRIPARVVSEGTLRLLGLLAIASMKEAPSLVAFEEPENGVHPRRIQQVAELLQGYSNNNESQLIVTTHSPVFIDSIQKVDLYVVSKENHSTRITALPLLPPLLSNRKLEIVSGLSDTAEPTPLSERLMRGDYDL